MALRVIQWGTGNVGAFALRQIIEHPKLELAAVYVHGQDRAGKDAAELCGLSKPTGVRATNDVEAILALEGRLRLLHGDRRSSDVRGAERPGQDPGIGKKRGLVLGGAAGPPRVVHARDPRSAGGRVREGRHLVLHFRHRSRVSPTTCCRSL